MKYLSTFVVVKPATYDFYEDDLNLIAYTSTTSIIHIKRSILVIINEIEDDYKEDIIMLTKPLDA